MSSSSVGREGRVAKLATGTLGSTHYRPSPKPSTSTSTVSPFLPSLCRPPPPSPKEPVTRALFSVSVAVAHSSREQPPLHTEPPPAKPPTSLASPITCGQRYPFLSLADAPPPLRICVGDLSFAKIKPLRPEIRDPEVLLTGFIIKLYNSKGLDAYVSRPPVTFRDIIIIVFG
ncbi:hypothetical protein RIF29_38368 [Crotalaria pallida]|uniref:Uncharacterized protein n=1 Tax=Crotalaria pallida TaxID=3830 RepID=A0AAN9E4K8_CROPI